MAKPTQQFVCTMMTSRQIEEDAGFPLVTYLVEKMMRQILQVMGEQGYALIARGPKIEREERWGWAYLSARGLRRLAEKFHLAKPREVYEHLGYQYRMSVWAV